MASSAKTEFQAGVYTEPGRSSAGQRRHWVIAPGIDHFYEIFYRFGLHILLLGMLLYSCWTYIG